jgi:hypothetical protein
MKISSLHIIAALLLAVIGAAMFLMSPSDRPMAKPASPLPVAKASVSPAPAPASSAATPDSESTGFKTELDRALGQDDPRKRSMKFGALLTKWAGSDPEAALDYVRNMSPGPEAANALLTVLEPLGKTDPQRAVKLAGELAVTREQQAIFSVLFHQIAGEDVSQAVACLPLVPAGEGRLNALRALVTVWADADANAALNWAKTLASDDDRNAALETALLSVAGKNPSSSLDLARQFLTGDALNRVLAIGLKRLIGTDPLAASRLVGGMNPGPAQTESALEVSRALAARQPETAIAWLQSLSSPELRRILLNSVVEVWGTANPKDAGQFVSQMPKGAEQDAAVERLAGTWGKANPGDAVRWAETLNGSARNAALVSIASGWARKDPVAATQWAGTWPTDSPVRSKTIKDALSYWVMQDSRAAGSFVGTLPQADQPQAIEAVAPVMAQQDAPKAIAWAKSLTDSDIRDIALQQVVTRWADNEPAAAAPWVLTEPEGTARAELVHTIAMNWMASNSGDALIWVESLPPGASRDSAADAVAAKLAPTDPANAAGWAESISRLDLRSARMEQVAEAWLKIDRTAAQAWVRNANLPPEAKLRLLR